MDTCTLDCNRKLYGRGLCKPHFNEHRDAGTLPEKTLSRGHSISSINEITRTASCSICGDNIIVIPQSKRGAIRWQCRNKEQQRWLSRSTSYTYGDNNKIDSKTLSETRHKLFIAQDGKCAICGNQDFERALCLDHCHDTGKIRGLLCGRCNSGIGMLDDNRELLLRAADYLSDT